MFDNFYKQTVVEYVLGQQLLDDLFHGERQQLELHELELH